MEAPPPVEIQLILSARPNLLMAATESPPPMIEVQSESAMARATASVPCAKLSNSKAHRAVPEDGLGGLDGVGVELLGLGADVHALTVVRDGVGGDDLRHGVLAEVVGDAVVDREEDLDALLLGLLQHLAGARGRRCRPCRRR